jgi:hypothetical protein
MTTYKLTGFNSAVRQSDWATIPFVDGNADYAEYKAWLAAGNAPLPSDASSMPALRIAQFGLLAASYAAAIAQPVTFTTTAGASKTFQTDPASIQNLSSMLAAFGPAAAAPSGFYWVAADNTQVPFTLADMQGLAAALGSQGWDAFQRLQQRKAAVLAASSAPSIAAVIW